MPAIDRRARLSLIIARMAGQIPARERAGDNDMLAVVLPRREWALVRACISAEIDRINDQPLPSSTVMSVTMVPPTPAPIRSKMPRPGYRRELAFIAVTAILGSAIAWAITLGL